jgi:hypothetical protein
MVERVLEFAPLLVGRLKILNGMKNIAIFHSLIYLTRAKYELESFRKRGATFLP